MVRYCDHNPGNIKTDLVRYAESWLRTIFVSDRSHSYERSHLFANNSHIIKTELVHIPYNPSRSTNTTLCWNERRSSKFERSGTVQVWPLLCWWEADRGVNSSSFYLYPSALLPSTFLPSTSQLRFLLIVLFHSNAVIFALPPLSDLTEDDGTKFNDDW